MAVFALMNNFSCNFGADERGLGDRSRPFDSLRRAKYNFSGVESIGNI